MGRWYGEREEVLNALPDIEEAVVATTALGRLQALVTQLRQHSLDLPDQNPQERNNRPLVEVSSEEDQEDDDQEAHANQVRVRSGPGARREYRICYLNADSVIAELHFEVARIMRRGAETFFLVLNDVPLLGWREVNSTIATRKITDRKKFPENYLEIGNGLPTRKNSVWEFFGSVTGIKSVII